MLADCQHCRVAIALVLLAPAARGEDETCVVLCRPALKLEPTLVLGPLSRPKVQDVTTRAVRALPMDVGFELTLGLGIQTQLQHVNLALETTLPIPDSRPEIEAELSLVLLPQGLSRGWVELHVDLVDQLSPGMRPRVINTYTHKLDFELDLTFLPFKWLPSGAWLRNVELGASLDYLATGLPQRGDLVDGDRYISDVRGWSVSIATVLPLAPLVPE